MKNHEKIQEHRGFFVFQKADIFKKSCKNYEKIDT